MGSAGIYKAGGRRGVASVSFSLPPLDLQVLPLTPLSTTTIMSDNSRQSLSDKMGAAIKVRALRLGAVRSRVLPDIEHFTARL